MFPANQSVVSLLLSHYSVLSFCHDFQHHRYSIYLHLCLKACLCGEVWWIFKSTERAQHRTHDYINYHSKRCEYFMALWIFQSECTPVWAYGHHIIFLSDSELVASLHHWGFLLWIIFTKQWLVSVIDSRSWEMRIKEHLISIWHVLSPLLLMIQFHWIQILQEFTERWIRAYSHSYSKSFVISASFVAMETQPDAVLYLRFYLQPALMNRGWIGNYPTRFYILNYMK